MSTKGKETKPLEAARQRISSRKIDLQEAIRIAQEAAKNAAAGRRAERDADAAEFQRLEETRQEAWESRCPEDLKALVRDVKKEIETKEGITLSENFQVIGNEDEEYVKIALLAAKTIPGKEKPEPAFFHGEPPKRKTPDIRYNYSFALKYNINGIVEWSMGNPIGHLAPEAKHEPALDRMTVTTFALHEDLKYAGTLSYSKENFDKLAETLVQHLDRQHYRYQIREKPIVMYPQTLPIQTDLLD